MLSRILHTLTDLSSSRRGKFLVIAAWLVAAVALVSTAPACRAFTMKVTPRAYRMMLLHSRHSVSSTKRFPTAAARLRWWSFQAPEI